VQQDGRLVAMLPRGELLTALARQGEKAVVGDVMRRDFQTVAPTETLERVLERLQDCSCQALPVVENDQVVGLVTRDSLGEFLVLNSASMGKRKKKSRP
jgi:CBS-domain-containing membrane protein